MNTLREAAAQQLRWIADVDTNRGFELRGSESVLATLRWVKAEGSLAIAEAGTHRWTFKRSGFLKPKIRVRRAGFDVEVAVLVANSIGEAILDGPEGRRYRWSATNFWRSEWAFSGSGGELVFRIKPSAVSRRPMAEVQIAPAAVSLPDLELLVVLGWYLLVLVSFDAGGEPAAWASLFE